MHPVILGEQVIERRGTVVTVRRFLKGWFPELGQLHWGLSGPETVVETTVIRTMRLFSVVGTTREAAA